MYEKSSEQLQIVLALKESAKWKIDSFSWITRKINSPSCLPQLMSENLYL